MLLHSVDPTTSEPIASYETMTAAMLDPILDNALTSQKKWAKTSLRERASCLQALSDQLLARKQALAVLMSHEMGKILSQGVAEIEKCAWLCRYLAENGARFLATEEIDTEAHRSFISFRPLGVILGIMPWNYPFWQVLRFATAALIGGNGVLLKHAPNVCGCSLAIEQLFADAGFPEHLFHSLLIDVSETTALIHDPRVAAVSVTSSVATGRAVAAEAGRALKKCVLELGGSDPFIILDDANLERAVDAAITSRFQNSGQSCIAAKRFILVDSVYDDFAHKFVDKVSQLRMGNPLEQSTQIGPMARFDLRDSLADQVQRSVARGANILTGGHIPAGPGAFYAPTVLTNVKRDMPAFSEELFGPVAALIRVSDEHEAIQVANATDFGLSGSVWTADLERGQKIAEEAIESGAAFVNSMSKSDPRMPFGGTRHSGYGRELSGYGVREFVNIHAVWVENNA